MDTIKENNTSDSGLLAFDPIVLLRDLMKRWYVVVAAAIVIGAAAYIYKDLTYTPQYRTTATFVVTSRSSSSTVYSNLSSATALANVFSEVINSSVMRKVILEDTGLKYFDGTISASCIPQTNLLTLSVTSSDPEATFVVTRSIINNHEQLTFQIIGDIVLDILKDPVVPTYPINSSGAVSMMRTAMLAAALGTSALIVFASYNRDAVRSAKEVRKKLDCHFLGEIPHEKKFKTIKKLLANEKSGIVISNPTTSFGFTENIRKLRRRIEQRMGAGRVLMVTSVMENEGKSTVAVNIALALRQKYDRVLLLESDLRKPAIHTIMQQKDVNVTVRDVLLNGANPADAITKDRNTGLYMMLDPKGIRNPGDILSSPSMNELLAWTREHFEYVVVDLPPMSVATDAESVLEFADSSLLVVRQNVVKADALNRAIAAMKRGKAKLVGCVLNNVYSSFVSSGQGIQGGHYSKYGKYGKYGAYATKKSDL
jgi:capsular exopolysaccharide synthesis family protein